MSKGFIVKRYSVIYEYFKCKSCGAEFSERPDNMPCWYCDKENFEKWIKLRKGE